MNDIEINNLWKSYDEKLDKLLSINQEIMTEITKTKANSMLGKAKPAKYLGIIIGLPYILVLDALFIIGWLSGGIFFALSMGAIAIFTKIAFGTYIYHLILIRQASHADTVVEMQKKIAQIKTSSIKVLRIVVLQLPFWTTWYFGMYMAKNADLVYWIGNIVVTGIFTYFSLWLFWNIKIENIDKKWMKWLFSDAEWISVIKAIDLLDQIDNYKKTPTVSKRK